MYFTNSVISVTNTPGFLDLSYALCCSVAISWFASWSSFVASAILPQADKRATSSPPPESTVSNELGEVALTVGFQDGKEHCFGLIITSLRCIRICQERMNNEATLLRRVVGSRLLAALVFLLGVEIWFAWAQPLATAPTANLQRTEPFQASREYLRQSAPPDVVLLGSSVLVSPVLQAEALSLRRQLPRLRYRESRVLAEALGARGLGTRHVFNFAVGGCMISDAFWIAKNVICAHQNSALKPRAIVYGIAPRDIQDNIMQQTGIPATDTFRCFAALDDAAVVKSTIGMNVWTRMDLVLSRASQLWRYRTDLRAVMDLYVKKAMESTLPWVAFEKTFPDGTRKAMKGGTFAEEAYQEPLVSPGRGMEYVSAELTDQQYAFRYNPLSPKMMELQLGYLNKLFELCRRNDITLIVVNMPLSEHNRKLMPPTLYPFFVDRLTKACREHGTELIDLSSSRFTADANFEDGVHLNCEQSEPFIRHVAERLSSTALAPPQSRQVSAAGTSK